MGATQTLWYQSASFAARAASTGGFGPGRFLMKGGSSDSSSPSSKRSSRDLARTPLRRRTVSQVCNAGILQPTDFLDIELDEWKRIHEVNLHGVFNTMQLGCRGMVKDSKEWASARSHDGAAVGGATAASAAAPEKATGALPAEDAAAGGGSAGAPGGTGFFGRVITIASQAGEAMARGYWNERALTASAPKVVKVVP